MDFLYLAGPGGEVYLSGLREDFILELENRPDLHAVAGAQVVSPAGLAQLRGDPNWMTRGT